MPAVPSLRSDTRSALLPLRPAAFGSCSHARLNATFRYHHGMRSSAAARLEASAASRAWQPGRGGPAAPLVASEAPSLPSALLPLLLPLSATTCTWIFTPAQVRVAAGSAHAWHAELRLATRASLWKIQPACIQPAMGHAHPSHTPQALGWSASRCPARLVHLPWATACRSGCYLTPLSASRTWFH